MGKSTIYNDLTSLSVLVKKWIEVFHVTFLVPLGLCGGSPSLIIILLL